MDEVHSTTADDGDSRRVEEGWPMNRRFRNHNEVGPFFARLAETATVKLERVAASVAEVGKQHVEATFGRNPPLQELQADTISEKEKRGAQRPSAPLIDTGALAASFQTKVYPVPAGFVAGVGTPDPLMYYHELGTGHVPPRPAVQEGGKNAIAEQLVIVRAGGRAIATGEGSVPRAVTSQPSAFVGRLRSPSSGLTRRHGFHGPINPRAK